MLITFTYIRTYCLMYSVIPNGYVKKFVNFIAHTVKTFSEINVFNNNMAPYKNTRFSY